MVKFLKFTLARLLNVEHFQFLTEFRDLLHKFTLLTSKTNKLFVIFNDLYLKEDECLVVLQKSSYTEPLAEADRRRDNTFRGLVSMINATLRHFDTDTVEAAKRLKILLDTYGDLAAKSNDAETSGISNLIQDLEDKYTNDIQTTKVSDWIAELKANNKAFEILIKNRDQESAAKPEAKMKEIRVKIDEAYRNLTQAIESLEMLSEDESDTVMYNDFITQFNVVVQRYKNRIAQREGMRAAKNNSPNLPDSAFEEASKNEDL